MKSIKDLLIVPLFLLDSSVNSQLVIHSPQSLVDLFPAENDDENDGLIDCSYANFGFVPYGHAMLGKVYFNPTLDTVCETLPDQPFKRRNAKLEDQTEEQIVENFLPPFMIADRGDCSFVKKVRNMEDAGVALAIIVDNTNEEIEDIVMSDDGTGAGIRIPSVLVSKSDGQKLTDFMRTASQSELDQISVLIDFDMTRPDNRVEYDLWYSSSNDLALDFLQDFMKLDKVLGDSALMTPRFVFWVCVECDEEFMHTNCFGAGKYCATENGNEKIEGKEIVLEDLRQMCIYQQAYAEGADRQMFWDYIKEVHSRCDNVINEQCSKLGHKEVEGLSWTKTTDCVKSSFSTPDESKWHEPTTTNHLIESDIEYWADYGTSLFPSIVINNSTYRGQLETQAVFNAICAGFAAPPKSCWSILETYDVGHHLEVGIIYYDDGYSFGHVIGILLMFTVMLFVTLCCYRRYAKRQMQDVLNTQVETAVNHYISLSQKEESQASTRYET